MRSVLLAILSLALGAPCLAQNSDTDPATRDDVILFFRTVHSFDMMQKMLEVQSKSVQQLMHDQLAKDGQVPADFDVRMQKMLDSLVKGMPVDEMSEASIPAYQRHFTRGDIEALNAFYSSPVGQKYLHEVPAVTQEAMQDIMPIMSKYLSEWREKVDKEFKDNPPAKAATDPAKD
jgi:hypothetical protein